MDNQFTPGLWQVDDSREHIVTVVSPWTDTHRPVGSAVFGDYRGGIVCEMHWNTGVPTKAQAMANARLIAAAPDLLQSLRQILTDHGIDPDGSPEGYDRNTQNALAAIRKAQGGQP